jgi:hypothetical protein
VCGRVIAPRLPLLRAEWYPDGLVSTRSSFAAVAVLILWGCGGSDNSSLFSPGTTAHGGSSGTGGDMVIHVTIGVGGAGGAVSTGGRTGSGGNLFGDTGGSSPEAGGRVGFAGSDFGTGGTQVVPTDAGTGTGGAGVTKDAGPTVCQDGQQKACACPIASGVSTCQAGVFGPCACPSCEEGKQSDCACPDGTSSGVANCVGGRLGGCRGCPVAPSGCPVGVPCTASGQGSTPYCGSQGGLPPSCANNEDCALYGVNCTFLPIIGGVCLKSCTP